jgi:hypothetical protein
MTEVVESFLIRAVREVGMIRTGDGRVAKIAGMVEIVVVSLVMEDLRVIMEDLREVIGIGVLKVVDMETADHKVMVVGMKVVAGRVHMEKGMAGTMNAAVS